MSQSLTSSLTKKDSHVDLSVMNEHIKNILVTVSQNPVTNVVAPTGVGKTTKLPIGIADAGNKITVVVSDSGIASSLVGHVSTLTNESVSNDLSSPAKIRYIGESELKDHIYKIIQHGRCLDLDFSDVLMIDQADRGSMDQYLIIALWKYCASLNARIPRMLLVSNTPLFLNNLKIELYTIDTNYYPVEIRYANTDYSLSSYDSTNDIVKDTVNLVYELSSSIEGDMLIFTSGTLQIENLVSKLLELNMKHVEILPAHQDLIKEDIDRIYTRTGKKKKIIVADSLAETTFTLDKLEIIIDLMMCYRKELSLTGGQRYHKRYISQSQADLRSSRGGKYTSTISYRMMSQELFNRLLNTIEPEIYRTPLHWIMLELIQNRIDPYKVLDIFDKGVLDRMYKLILDLGLVNTAGRISPAGKFTLKIPYGVRQATTLYQWIEKEYPPYPAIVILSLIDAYNRSYYIYPFRTNDTSHAEYNLELLEHRKTYFEPFVGKSDVHTYCNIWTVMMDEIGGSEVPSSDIHDWCENNYIRYENMSEAISLNRTIVDILNKDLSSKIEIGPFDTDNLLDLLTPILAYIYKDRKLTYDNRTEIIVRYIDSKGEYYKIDSINGINTVDADIPEIVYGLITSTITSEYSANFNTIICSLV
jgi:HrpA-like RNA helicase